MDESDQDRSMSSGSEASQYSVEEILNKRVVKGRVEYFLKWKEYGEEYNNWEPEENLACPELIEEFEKRWELTKKEKEKGKKKQQVGKKIKQEMKKNMKEDKKKKAKKEEEANKKKEEANKKKEETKQKKEEAKQKKDEATKKKKEEEAKKREEEAKKKEEEAKKREEEAKKKEEEAKKEETKKKKEDEEKEKLEEEMIKKMEEEANNKKRGRKRAHETTSPADGDNERDIPIAGTSTPKVAKIVKESTTSVEVSSVNVEDEASVFDEGRNPEKIIGASDSNGELAYLLKWEGADETDLIPAHLAHLKVPLLVIHFLEERITWQSKTTSK